MVTEHCVLMPPGHVIESCGTCRAEDGMGRLRRRKGYAFPVLTRSARVGATSTTPCRSTWHARASRASSRRGDGGPSGLHARDVQQAGSAHQRGSCGGVGRGRAVGKGAEASRASSSRRTTGHFFRGVR